MPYQQSNLPLFSEVVRLHQELEQIEEAGLDIISLVGQVEEGHARRPKDS